LSLLVTIAFTIEKGHFEGNAIFLAFVSA